MIHVLTHTADIVVVVLVVVVHISVVEIHIPCVVCVI